MKSKVAFGILLAVFLIAIAGGYLIFFTAPTSVNGSPSYPIASDVYTTLDRTVLPVPVPSTSPGIYPYQVANYSEYGYGVWQYGGGLGYQRRLDLMPPAYANTSVTGAARLLRFFTMSDIHLADKETPAQAVYSGYKGGNPSGYSATMLTTTQVLDAAVQTANALHLQKPFDFGIFLGDAINNNQYNELRWYIGVLDGKTVNPDSGARDDPIPGPLNDYQDTYKAAGLNTTIKWYQTLGNHDHFWLGSYRANDYLRQTITGKDILNAGTMLIDRNASLEQRGFYMGSMDGRTRYGDVIGAGPVKDFTVPPQVPAADPDRRSLSTEEWLGEFFNTTSEPQGHGFNRTDASTGFACYSFEPKTDIPIKVIVLDDTLKNTDPAISSYELASLDEKRYNWLVSELDTGQAEGKLMIISAHIPIRNEPPGPSRLWSTLSPVSEQTLVARLHTYPNLILWMSGHTHQNTVTAMPSPDPIHPEFGFWEVETASLRDFPQQFRTFDIVRNSDNTISIFTTDVDPAVRSGSLAETSRSYAVASSELFANTITGSPGGSYNAELVKQLTPEMQAKIQSLGTPAGR